MKKMAVVFLVLINLTLLAQFQQTNGPSGINITSIATVDETLYGLTYNRNLFSYENGNWERVINGLASYHITEFNNRLYAVGDGVSYYDKETNELVKLLDGYFNSYTVNNDRFFVVSNDTVYHTNDGFNWVNTFDSLTSEVVFSDDTVSQTLRNVRSIVKRDSVYILACTGDFSITQNGIYVSHDNGQSWFEPEGLEQFSNVTKVIQFNDDFYLLTTTGLYVSNNNGLTWQFKEEGFTNNETNKYIYDVVINNGNLYALQYTPRKLFKLTNDVWQPIDIPLEMQTITSFSEDRLILSDYSNVYIFNTENKAIENISSEIAALNTSVLALDKETVLAYNYNSGSFLSTNGGNSWIKLPVKFIRAVALNNSIFITDRTGVFKTDDLGETLTNVNSNLPSDYVESISDIGTGNGNIYAAFSRTRARTHLSPVWEAGGIYKSTNNGESWVSSSNGLPSVAGIKVPVNKLFVQNDILIASTLEGTYRSTNSGSSWVLFENGFSESSRPIYYGGINDMIFISTYFDGPMYTSKEMNNWQAVTAGLDTVHNGYYYRFIEENGKMFLYDIIDKKFYKFNNGGWVSASSSMPDELVIYNFSSVSGQTYAAVYDGGIWKGSIESLTGVGDEALSSTFELSQNYPNPFNPSTKIKFSITDVKTQHAVSLQIYNSLGQQVTTLVNEQKSPGVYEVEFDGSKLSSGVYFYKLRYGNINQTRKMVLIK